MGQADLRCEDRAVQSLRYGVSRLRAARFTHEDGHCVVHTRCNHLGRVRVRVRSMNLRRVRVRV